MNYAMKLKLIVLFYLLLFSISFGNQVSIESSKKNEGGFEVRQTKIVRGSDTLFISIERVDEGKAFEFTEMFFFDGSLVAIFSCDLNKNLSFTQVKHDSPVAVTLEDLDRDGIVDRVLYSKDSASDLFISNGANTYFRSQELGMIPVVDAIYDSKGFVYLINVGAEAVEVEKVRAETEGTKN